MKKALTFIAALLMITAAGAQEIQSQWNGKRVAFLGDSITDPALAQRSGWRNYWSYLEDILGIKASVYGINGRQMDDIDNQAQRLYNERAMDIDAIIIFCGTNDFNASIPLGEWYSEEEVTINKNGSEVTLKHRIPEMTDSTFRGRINIAMDWIKDNYPTKQVILLTPIHRGFASFGRTNVQPEELYSNLLGKYLDDYVEAIKETANVWSVPVIDLNAICGIYPMKESNTQYINKTDTDRLHPGSAGHRRMAYALAYQLMAYPAGF